MSVKEEFHQRTLHSVPLQFFLLRGFLYPTDETMLVSRFTCDTFLPDLDHPARMSRIPLLKGAAVQHNVPRKSLKTIDLVGIFNSMEDKDNLLKLYHCNLPLPEAPFPTEYLLVRKDYLELVTPKHQTITVRFATQPESMDPVRGLLGRLVYPMSLRLYYVDESESFL